MRKNSSPVALPWMVNMDNQTFAWVLPVTIGKNGWEKILPLELTAAEQEAFEKSAAAVRSMNEVLG